MSFTASQLRKLKAGPKPERIRERQHDGMTFQYLEGPYAIAEANRILGFDAWDRETLSNTCVWSKQMGPRFCAAYLARIRITVRTSDRVIVREASGAGEAEEMSAGAAHERAAKSAETDATKRALCTLGNAFGLGLYLNKTSKPATSAAAQHVCPIEEVQKSSMRDEGPGWASVPK